MVELNIMRKGGILNAKNVTEFGDADFEILMMQLEANRQSQFSATKQVRSPDCEGVKVRDARGKPMKYDEYTAAERLAKALESVGDDSFSCMVKSLDPGK